MFQPKLKSIAGAVVALGTVLSLHAQMAQDPLLSRTAAVEPNIVFMFDDSGSMPATAVYQFGGTPGGMGLTGPGDDSFSEMLAAPTTRYGRSPDINLIYYDPRVTYSRRINADGTFQAAGSTGSFSSFDVYFYKPPTLSPTYSVNSVPVTSRGSGYPATGIVATFAQPPSGGVQATADVVTSTSPKVGGVVVTSGGRGYPATGIVMTFGPPAAGGVQATGTVQVGPSPNVSGVTVVTRGRDYPAGGVTATFSAPATPGGVTATGTVVMDGSTAKVFSATPTSIGSGYALGTTVTFSAPPPGGVRATGTPIVTPTQSVTSITVSGGGCYPSGVTATLSAPVPGGVQAIAGTVTRAGSAGSCTGGRRPITSIAISNGGSGYTSIPTVSFSSGSGGTFTPVLGAPTNSITGINITDAGSGYTSAPTLTFSTPGSGAAFNLAMATSYRIGGITMTNQGSGYTTAPTITLNNTGAGSGATFSTTAGLTNVITGINVTNGGAGYTSTPSITLAGTGSGSGASFNVVLGTTNVISAINVTNAGSGYVTQPTLSLTGTAPGTGAAFSVNYNTILVQPANRTWDGTGTPTGSSSFFNPYTPDSGSPLAPGALLIDYPNTASSSTPNYPKFKNRTDCDPTVCTWAQEKQNYANWKRYHSTRLELAKTGIGLAFQPLNPTFRLGWGTINTLEGSSRLDKGVRLYNSTVQSEFLTWLYGVSADGNTPNRIALNKVGQYYQRGDDDGPWGNAPSGDRSLTGSGDNTSHASCRRSYAMLMTDGYYNDSFSLSDVDTSTGPKITNPTTYQYTPIGPYSDTASGTKFQNSFADVAMKYWINDLRPNLPNNVRSVTGDEAYWQHMNFYAIGLGITGTLNAADPAILARLTGGTATTPPRSLDWPTPASDSPRSIDDMWHATVNGRGKLLNAKTSDELNNAIQQMMSDIGGKEGTQSGVAVSTASLTKETKKYTPSYTPVTWNGNVTAYNLDPTSGNQTGIAWQVETLTATDPITGVKTYSSLIPAAASRNIVVGTGATSGPRAVPFTYASMSSASLLGSMNGTVTPALIDYLRGDATNEDTSASSSSSTAIYRGRLTRLADIVNSTPVFVKDSIDLSYDTLPGGTPGQATYRSFIAEKTARREGVLFVGANDGMLHAFRDGTYDPNTGAVVIQGGVETFAYVPNALLPTLNQLADKTYTHRFYVDGPNTETDAYFGGGFSSTGWANIVLGSTGAGAGAPGSAGVSPRTAVYALDVTSLNSNPTTLGAASVLWEASSSNPSFAELGYLLTDVQAGPTVGGQWVAIFGNGYESKSCQARLFVVNLQTGALIREINTNAGNCATAKNGLGGVRIVRNARQQIIGVYAGDLQGNLWKFSLNDVLAANWKVDLGGTPLFTAGATQPITAPPGVLTLPSEGAANPATGYMVVAGTGKFYEIADITSTAQQSLYGIWDPVAFGAVTIPAGTALTNKSLLVQQTIGAAQVAPNGNTYFPISTNAVTYTGATPNRGWYINLPNSGQRLVYPLDILSERYAAADTISPSNVSLDPCSNTTGGTGYFYLIDALTGAGPTEAILDTNGDGNVDSEDMVVSGLEGKADGRNVTLRVSKNASAETYVNVSGGNPGATLIKLPCTVLGRCKNPTGGGSGIKSREWRQLFMR